MTSERIQRRIERLLDQIDTAEASGDWHQVFDLARDVLAIDQENGEALAYRQSAERRLGFLTESGAGSPLSDTAVPSLTPPLIAPPPLPTSFAGGRYTVKRFLGEGGKKKVFLAHDSLLDRDVAFALIKTDGLDFTGRARITREAQAMGRLGSHPHIVTVFDLGQEGEQPYMVTELMQGGDVEGLIEKASDHRIPLEETLDIAKAVCQGLEFAHGRGIVHRDLKPGNVWLTADPSTGSGRAVAKIGDFGLAVAVDRSRLTQAGMMVGTVSYMPPEQALGGQVDARSDLYSLGAMMYEMVCGRPPFVGDESVAIISQHINTPPVAPSWHNPNCPKALEEIVLRLLAKSPEDRPHSAADVMDTLNAIDLSVSTTTESERAEANPLDRLARGTFVGRTQEMAQGRSMVEDAFSGRVSLLLITGELGIGKTRLAEEIATYSSLRGAAVLWGVSNRDQGVPPYWPWVQALRGYVRSREPARLRSELGSVGPEVAKMVSDIREHLPDLPPDRPGDPAQERFRLFDSITTFLRNASSSQPLVIILDNVHYADEPTLLLAQFLLHEARDSRLLIIGTYREIETGRRNPIRQLLSELGRERNFRRMPLRGLSREETGRFLEALTGAAPSEPLVQRVYGNTEGVPLFIEEVVHLLTEEGRLEAPPDRMEIPQSVRDVIAQRLDRLNEETIEALTLAALLEREFDLPVLRELTGKGEAELLELLEPAVTSRMVEAVSGSLRRYQFVHGLTRQCLTADLPTTRLVRLHGRIGGALERVYGSNAERHAAQLAFHFGQAAALTDAQEKAVRYNVLAARAAETIHAYEDTINHYQNALSIIRETGQETSGTGLILGQDEILLLRGLATAQRFANRIPEAFRNFRVASHMAQARGDGQLVGELALEQDLTGFVPPDLRVRILTEGLDAVPDRESELAAMLHACIVGPLRARNRPSEAEEHQNMAREVAARKGYRKVELRISANELGQAVNLLKLDLVPGLEERLEELETEVGSSVDNTVGVRFLWPLLLGDIAGSRERAARALEAMRRARNTAYLFLPLRFLGTADYFEGNFSQMEQTLGLKERTERSAPDEYMEMARAVLAEARGDLDEARAAVESAIQASTRLRTVVSMPKEMVYLVGIERRAGNGQQAASLYRQATEEWERTRAESPPLVTLYTAALVALEAAAQGHASALTRCRELLEPYGGMVALNIASPTPVVVDRALGVIAAAEARWEQAAGYLERGETFCGEKGLVVELAHCRMALADALMHRNPATGVQLDKSPISNADRQRATVLYAQALADYQRLGMPLYVQDVLARRELLKA